MSVTVQRVSDDRIVAAVREHHECYRRWPGCADISGIVGINKSSLWMRLRALALRGELVRIEAKGRHPAYRVPEDTMYLTLDRVCGILRQSLDPENARRAIQAVEMVGMTQEGIEL